MQILIAALVLIVIFTGFLYKSIVGVFVAMLLSLAAFALWRTRFKILGIALAIALALPPLTMGTSSLYSRLHTYVHRYRLVVEVETPAGMQSKANVIQVSHTLYMLIWNPSAPGFKTQSKGEAIFFDLGDGRNLVVTLSFGPTGSNVDMLTYLTARVFGRDQAFWFKKAPDWTGKADLHGELIPLMVTFSNPADPATARVVHPDEFEKAFGPGYRFKGAWLEMTKDDWTKSGLEQQLPWLKNYKDLHKLKLYNVYKNDLYFYEGLFIRDS